MKILTEFPPNYREIVDTFDGVEKGEPIFCYGDTIYNPHKKNITKDLEVHEAVHMKQQGDAPELWWYNYLRDPEFRLSQEIEAYGEQYKFIKEAGMKGSLLRWALDNMATALSGNIYGNLLSRGEANSKIRNYGKT